VRIWIKAFERKSLSLKGDTDRHQNREEWVGKAELTIGSDAVGHTLVQAVLAGLNAIFASRNQGNHCKRE
jgi:hypothetical protein